MAQSRSIDVLGYPPMINIAVSAQRVFIEAEVPKRLEWKLIPDAVITRLVEDVVQHRLNEITDTFIARSLDGLRP